MVTSGMGRCFRASATAGAILAAACVVLIVGSRPRSARADVILLRGGGQVEGKVVPDPGDKDKVQVWLLQGRKPLSFQKAKILEVIKKASPLDDYFVKQKKTAETAQAQYDLATWCEGNKLNDLARLHYEAALYIDRSFEPAHRKLGHVYHDGYWLTREELSAKQGLVMYKGRFVSTEEKAKREDEDKALVEKAGWVRRIKMLRQAIVSGSADRRREAEGQLMAIRQPEAVGPLLRVLGNDEPPQRILLAQVLAAMPVPEATAGLVKLILAEPLASVRGIVFDKLKERDDPTALPRLAKALSSSQIAVINRAAWTLGNLNAVGAVPKLIPALITDEQQIVMVQPGSPSPGMITPGVAPLRVTNSSVAVLTPPAVSQGAVAYGSMSVPFYEMPAAGILDVGTQIRQPEPRVMTFSYRNVEVLSALQKLTNEDFGYDMHAWRDWVSRKYNPNPRPARRVPEP
jgi:hypothetical protein